MQKGKFGFSLWLYPFISMWVMLFNQTLANVIILGFVIAVEKDEWAIKQCAHVLMFSIYWSMYNFIIGMVEGWLSSIPLVGGLAATPLNIIDTIVWLILVVLCFVLGLSRLKRGEDIGLPGKKIINRAYGYAQQQWDGGGRQQQHYQRGQGYQQSYQQQPDYRQQPYQPPQYQNQPSYQAQGQGYQPPQPPPSQDYYAGQQQQAAPPPPPPASPGTNRPAPPPPPPPPQR